MTFVFSQHEMLDALNTDCGGLKRYKKKFVHSKYKELMIM